MCISAVIAEQSAIVTVVCAEPGIDCNVLRDSLLECVALPEGQDTRLRGLPTLEHHEDPGQLSWSGLGKRQS